MSRCRYGMFEILPKLYICANCFPLLISRHSPADPEHERGRQEEKRWARDNYDPIKVFDNKYINSGVLTESDLQAVKEEVKAIVDDAVKYADSSPQPPADLARGLEFPTNIDTDYNSLERPSFADMVNKRTISPAKYDAINAHMAALRNKAKNGEITISEAVNLAIHEEMLRDPTTTSECISFIVLKCNPQSSLPTICKLFFSPSRRFASGLVVRYTRIYTANIWIDKG